MRPKLYAHSATTGHVFYIVRLNAVTMARVCSAHPFLKDKPARIAAN